MNGVYLLLMVINLWRSLQKLEGLVCQHLDGRDGQSRTFSISFTLEVLQYLCRVQ